MSIFDFCSINPIIPWLLPFILGLTLGYLLWSKYKSMVEHAERTNADLSANLKLALDENLSLRKSKESLDADLIHVKSKLREIETSLSATSAQLSSTAIEQSPKVTVVSTTNRGVPQTTNTSEAILTPNLASNIVETTPNTSPKTTIDDVSTSVSRSELVATNHLQVLEGIGPKVEEILNNNGISNFAQLSQKTPQQLRDILDTFGTKYRMIDPEPWISQSILANNQDWDGLVIAQREQYKLKNPKVNHLVDTKIEKHFMKLGIIKKYTQDDLKAVEGIGPKIEQLLHADGIKSWENLANTSVEKLKTILSNAGPKYMLADPTTWPKQAGLANNSLWAELEELQKVLKGGKEN
jgi:predicted flap endonuclease-1-like 5' DNA nuclease